MVLKQRILDRIRWGIVTVGLLAPLFFAGVAHADVNDFAITKFDADYTLTNADKQGELHVAEHIFVDFTDNNHGILRALPGSYKNHRLQLQVNKVSSTSGAPAHYSTYSSNGNTVLKIGDANKTVTGSQEYTVDYTVRNVITFYDDHDELYWDINGDQWGQVASQVAVHLHLPSGLRLGRQLPTCYTGHYGSVAHNCTVLPNTSGVITTQTVQPLPAYETLSTVTAFEKGYFAPSTWYESLGEYAGEIASFVIPFLLLGGSAGVLWFKRGRDAKGRGVIVPQYDAPDKMAPIEAGTIIDFLTDNRDITATIINLAIHRYITIIEQTRERKILKDMTTYTLRLEKTDTTGLNEFEAEVLQGLFSSFVVGEEVDLADLKYKLNKTALVLRKTVGQSLRNRGYFRTNPSVIAGMGVTGIVITAVVLAGVLLSSVGAPGAFVAGAVAGAVIAGIFIASLPSRTAKGVEAKEHMLGLKMYIEVAEKDRIKMMQSPNAPYAAKSAEPKRTVTLFEKLLPYAMVLGVEKQWAVQFKDIYRTPPDWYNGNMTAFSAVYLASALSDGVQSQVNSAFSSPSSSSGSGFSGGGAGGGGGGGGGGGW